MMLTNVYFSTVTEEVGTFSSYLSEGPFTSEESLQFQGLSTNIPLLSLRANSRPQK